MAAEPVRRRPPTCSMSALHSLRKRGCSGRPRWGMPTEMTQSASCLRAATLSRRLLTKAPGPFSACRARRGWGCRPAHRRSRRRAPARWRCRRWEPVQEVGGAVERVDDPAMGLVGAGDEAPLLHQEAVARPGLRQLAVDGLLGAVVGGGDEVAGPFTDTCSCSISPKSRASPAPPCARRRSSRSSGLRRPWVQRLAHFGGYGKGMRGGIPPDATACLRQHRPQCAKNCERPKQALGVWIWRRA
jgi:hypothetical protein